jgi:hypothetical protein
MFRKLEVALSLGMALMCGSEDGIRTGFEGVDTVHLARHGSGGGLF